MNRSAAMRAVAIITPATNWMECCVRNAVGCPRWTTFRSLLKQSPQITTICIRRSAIRNFCSLPRRFRFDILTAVSRGTIYLTICPIASHSHEPVPLQVSGGSTLGVGEGGHRPLQIVARPPNLAVLLAHCRQLLLR